MGVGVDDEESLQKILNNKEISSHRYEHNPHDTKGMSTFYTPFTRTV